MPEAVAIRQSVCASAVIQYSTRQWCSYCLEISRCKSLHAKNRVSIYIKTRKE